MNLQTMPALELLDVIARSGVSVFKLNSGGVLVISAHLVAAPDAQRLAQAMIDKTRRPIIELPDGFKVPSPANVN